MSTTWRSPAKRPTTARRRERGLRLSRPLNLRRIGSGRVPPRGRRLDRPGPPSAGPLARSAREPSAAVRYRSPGDRRLWRARGAAADAHARRCHARPARVTLGRPATGRGAARPRRAGDGGPLFAPQTLLRGAATRRAGRRRADAARDAAPDADGRRRRGDGGDRPSARRQPLPWPAAARPLAQAARRRRW